MSIVSNEAETMKRLRRRLAKIIINARTSRLVFKEINIKELDILRFINMYNYYINRVDIITPLKKFISRVGSHSGISYQISRLSMLIRSIIASLKRSEISHFIAILSESSGLNLPVNYSSIRSVSPKDSAQSEPLYHQEFIQQPIAIMVGQNVWQGSLRTAWFAWLLGEKYQKWHQ